MDDQAGHHGVGPGSAASAEDDHLMDELLNEENLCDESRDRLSAISLPGQETPTSPTRRALPLTPQSQSKTEQSSPVRAASPQPQPFFSNGSPRCEASHGVITSRSFDLRQSARTKKNAAFSMLQKQRRAEAKRRLSAKMPSSVNVTIPNIANAWENFLLLDVDGSGRLDIDEIQKLGQHLNLKVGSFQLKQAFKDMQLLEPPDRDADRVDRPAADGVSFEGFAQWYSRFQAAQRREMRRTVKELFESFDKDGTGILDKQEFMALVMKVAQDKKLPVISATNSNEKDSKQLRIEPEQAEGKNAYSLGALAATALSLSDIAWAEVRKVPYVSESRDKRHLADLMVMQERGMDSSEKQRLAGTAMGVNFPAFGVKSVSLTYMLGFVSPLQTNATSLIIF
eukprot:SAG31_NODE_3704_length_3973_cov_2.604285_1_plen_397_part_00